MHLAFIDIAVAYDANAPDEDRPLGGTNSAICFLARELVKAGIACTLFNKIREPKTAQGVRALPLEALIEECAKPDYTAFIFCGRWVEWLVKLVQDNSRAPILAWMHESTFDPKLVPALEAFRGIAFVSEWQQRINQPHVLPHWKQVVLRNAMNPRAMDLFQHGEKIMAAKARPPVLLYAGSTARGSFHLPPLLEKLRPLHKDFTLEIYSDVTPSRDAESNKKYTDWVRSLPNITHVGKVGQPELLQRMKRATLMLSPNPWPETSCIAMIEAMAAGLSVVTTNRGALPETAAGFARIVPLDDPDHPTRFDMPLPYDLFIAAVKAALDEWAQKPEGTEQKLTAQTAFFRAHYQWAQRVAPWVAFIKSFA